MIPGMPLVGSLAGAGAGVGAGVVGVVSTTDGWEPTGPAAEASIFSGLLALVSWSCCWDSLDLGKSASPIPTHKRAIKVANDFIYNPFLLTAIQSVGAI